MSKNKPKHYQPSWEEEQGRKAKLHQDSCRHKFTLVKLLDHLNDEMIEAGICKFCGYSPAY